MRRCAGALLLTLVFLAATGVVTTAPDWSALLCPPASCPGHPLGTDELGRDLLALIAVGLLHSILLASAALAGSLAAGVLLGSVLGVVPAGVDLWLSRVLDLFAALPVMLVALVAVGLFGRSSTALVVSLSLAGFVPAARVLRVNLRNAYAGPAVSLARWQGLGLAKVWGRHLGPVILRTLGPVSALLWPQLLLAEGMLGFLGLSLRDPAVTLGTLLAEGSSRIATAPWGVASTTSTLFLLVFVARRRE